MIDLSVAPSVAELRLEPRATMSWLLASVEREEEEKKEARIAFAETLLSDCFRLHPNTSAQRCRLLIEAYAEVSAWIADVRTWRHLGAGADEFFERVRTTLAHIGNRIDEHRQQLRETEDLIA